MSAARTGFLGLLLGLTGCHLDFDWDDPDFWVTETREYTVDADHIREISCTTHNGAIEVRAVPREEVLVVAEIKAGGDNEDDALECLESLDVGAELEGDRLIAKWKWDKRRRSQWRASVAFTILQPGSAETELFTHNGKIVVEGLHADAEACTHNGAIYLNDCEGNWRAETHNGRIEASGTPHHLDMTTHNGPIRLAVNTDGTVAGRIETHNGSVRVGLSDGANTQVTCHTGNGGISISRGFNHSSQRRRFFEGELGEGEGRMRIETHNGSITLFDPN